MHVSNKLKFLTSLAAAAMMLSAAIAQAQTLVVARGSDANSLDPAEGRSFEAIKMADWMFDGLVRFEGNSHKIVPALAESWEISQDGLTWTFKLRGGVTFHDGTPLNADAVVFSLERQRDKDHPQHCSECRRWNAKFAAIAKTEKVDDLTVAIKLKEPAPALLVNLAFYIGYIVSPTAVLADPENFRTNPVGTGPFKFVSWERDNFIELVRNDEYYQGVPKVEKLVVRVIPDNNVRLLALKKGEVHLIYGVPFPQFDEVNNDPNLNMIVNSTLGISFVALNTERKPFDDIRVRQAVNHAINRDRIFKTVFYGRGELANQIIPSNWFGHSKNVKVHEYDPEKAKALLAEAGQSDGFKTDLLTWEAPRPYLPAPRDAVSLIKADLAKVGIDVEIRTMKFGPFRAERGKGQYGLTMGGWISGTLDPDGIVYALYHSKGIREKDALNWARFRNDDLDAALDKGRAIYDQAERTPLYEKAADIIAENSIGVFLAHPITAIATRKELKNVFIHDSNWVPLHDAELTQ